MMTQAGRVIAKFGSARRLSQALATLENPVYHRHWSVIYRWRWTRDKQGRGGRIPLGAWPGILLAARRYGIYLTEADLSPLEEEE